MLKLASLLILCLHLTFIQGKLEIREFHNSKLVIQNDETKLVSPQSSVNFFAIGDWGGLPVLPYRTIIEQQTSRLMTDLAKNYNTQFQLALGDNFYFTGVQNEYDKRFKETYEDVFNSDQLLNTPWFVLMGNHDHYGNATAQIEYAKKSKRWVLPSYNYSVDIYIENGKELLATILMIDTVVACGNTPADADGPPQFTSKEAEKAGDDFFKNFEKQLARVAATNVSYILVSGHFPVWSIAEHGPTQCLVDNLRPLLHKYKVSAYLCGHDHNLQHFKDVYLGQNVDYVVSGCSNFVESSTAHASSVPPDSLKFEWSDKSKVINGGFVLMQASRENMTLTYYETTGKELYQTVILPRN